MKNMKQRLSPTDFPRLTELRRDAGEPDPYYFDIEHNSAVQAKHVREIESDLQRLDDAAWDVLKTDLIPLVKKRHPQRGWQHLLNKLNEAKGYNYLVGIGCSDVEFIPRASTQTPDLKGRLGSRKVLCEVKTISPSDDEFGCRSGGSVRSIETQLSAEFFNKLRSTLEDAREQMLAYCPDTETKRVGYVVVNYDDILHEYALRYSAQLKAFVEGEPVPGLDIEFDIKPPYYWQECISCD